MVKRQFSRCLLYQLLFFLFCNTVAPTTGFTIAGLFEDEDTLPGKAFLFAIGEANKNFPSIQLKPLLLPFNETDVSNATQQVCKALLAKPIAIFGPKSGPATARIRMVMSSKGVPHFETGFSYDPYSDDFVVLPPLRTIGSTVASLVRYYNWQSLIILYESEESLVQLLESFSETTVISRKFPRDSRLYLSLLEEAKKVVERPRIIVQAGLLTSQLLLRQFIRTNITTEDYHFIFINLDTYTMDMKPFLLRCPNCAITGLSLVQANEQMNHLMNNLTKTALTQVSTMGGPTLAAVIYDSVMILAKALDKEAAHLEVQAVSCHLDHTWSNGSRLISAIKQAEYRGATGNVVFDLYGKRNAFALSILDLAQDRFKEIGTWNEHDQLQMNQRNSMLFSNLKVYQEPEVLRVTVKMAAPYVMLKSSSQNQSLVGNDRFEGYCIDLLKEIVKVFPFNYTIHEATDKAYGAKDANGKWNGLVGELVRKEADLALGPLGITEDRSQVIDFTVSFIHSGLTILYKKPVKKDPNLFIIFFPLSSDVWLCILVVSIVVSITLVFLGRFSRYERAHSVSIKKNNFNLLNSVWFTAASLMQQGSDIDPRAPSTRVAATFWRFFSLILVSSYTANLAAFLTVERMVPPITSVDDLAKQTKIRYGVAKDSATMTFFKLSTIPTYSKMWEYMQTAQPSVFVKTMEEGVQRVLEEDYAFLAGNQNIEYYTERNCNLMQLGGLLYSEGIGLALQKGSLYRDKLSAAILTLQDTTILAEMKERWWKQKGGGQCQQGSDAGVNNSVLGLPNMAGAFVILLIGLGLGCLVSVGEYVYKRQKLPKNSHNVPRFVPALIDKGNDTNMEQVISTKL